MTGELTVIVPVWGNYARFLPQLRNRLRNEGVADGAVLVIVNGDRRLSDGKNLWPGARVIHLPRQLSIGAVRNAALEAVSTEFVCFCDADDLPAPGTLFELCTALGLNPNAVLATGLAERLTRNGSEPYPWPRRSAVGTVSRPRRVIRQWAFNNLSLTTGAVLRAEATRKLGGFPDSDLAEDGMLACAMAAYAPVIVLDRPTRQYRTHPDGLCQRGHSAARWRSAYRQQRRWLASNRALGPWRKLAHLYAPVHWYQAGRLAQLARHDV